MTDIRNWKENQFEEYFHNYKNINFIPERIYYIIIYKIEPQIPTQAMFVFYNLEEYRQFQRDFKLSKFREKYNYYTRILKS